MGRLGLGFGRGRRPRLSVAPPPPAPAPTPPAPTPAPTAVPTPSSPTGFSSNGSSNRALGTMLARVRSGNGRGRIVFKGDSTTVGQGAGSDSANYLAGARPNRVSAVLASLLTGIGTPTLDNSIVADNGMHIANGFAFPLYDTRVSPGSPTWSPYTDNGSLNFAGGGFLMTNTGTLSFTPDGSVNTFDILVFNSNTFQITVKIQGSSPASLTAVRSTGTQVATVSGNVITVPGIGSGYTLVRATAAVPGAYTLQLMANNSLGALRSVTAYNSATPAIDILNHAALGARAAQQSASGSEWNNNDALGFDAPDLTIINLGLNDSAANVSASAYANSLQAIITKAKLSGDVLLVSPHPAASNFSAPSTQIALRDAASALAANNSVAYMSLFDYFGGAFTPALQARMADGIVHGKSEFYAAVGDVYRRCIQAMAP